MTMRKTSMALLLMSACWIVPASASGTDLEDSYDEPADRPAMMPMTDTQAAAPSAAERIGQARAAHEAIIMAHLGATRLAQLEGLPVTGSDGTELGYVLTVDEDAELLQVHMPGEGKSVAIPANLVSFSGDTVLASTVSREDALAMVGTQSTRTMFAGLD